MGNKLKLPIGTQDQYNNVISIYLALVSKGVNPLVALELTNLKVAEKGWEGYSTGDNKKFSNVLDFTNHIIRLHKKMYPDSLKARNFELFWRGIQITPKYKYNSENPNYKQNLLDTRPGVKKRINFYRLQKGLSPLTLVDSSNGVVFALKGSKVLYYDPVTNSPTTRELLLKKYSPENSLQRNYLLTVRHNKYYNSPKGKTNYNLMVSLGYIPEESKKYGYVYHLNNLSRSEIEKNIPFYNRNDQIYYLKSLNNKDFIKLCAQAANRLNYNLGKPTVGDAWTRKGVYGDSVIWERPENWSYELNKRTFNTDMLLSGDIVDIKYPLSGYAYDASLYGRGNSHTGTIVKNPDTQEVFLVHNMGGNIYSIPLRKFMQDEEDAGILGMKVTRISRPMSKPKNLLATHKAKPQLSLHAMELWFIKGKNGKYPIELNTYKFKFKH